MAFSLVDLGICFRETGAVDAAEETLRRALLQLEWWSRVQPEESQLQNSIATCHNHLGLLYQDTGRLARAEDAFRQALTIREVLARTDASDVENAVYLGGTLCNLGHMHASRWQFPDALACYDRSIRALKLVLRAHRDNAQAEAFLSNARDARADMLARTAAIRKSSWRQRWFGWLPRIGVRGIKTPEFGITTLVGWRPAGPLPQLIDCGVPWSTEADGSLEAFQVGRYQEALQSLDHFVAEHPESVNGWFWRARVLGALRQYEDALESLEEALELQPDYTPAQCDKSDILRFLKRDREAFAEIESVLDRNSEYAHAWYLKGLILASYFCEGGRGETFDPAWSDETIEAFDQAILLDPDHFETRLCKGMTLSISCHCASAAVNILMHLATESLGEEAAKNYVNPHLSAFRGYLDRARESFHAAIRIRPNESAPWYQKGKLLAGLDGFENEAIEAFSQATQLQPDLADALYEWARLLSERGDRNEAQAHLRRAIAADPTLREKAREDFPWFAEQSF